MTKIQKTYRIRFSYNNAMYTIYVSKLVLDACRKFIMKLNNAYVPYKGRNIELRNALVECAKKNPGHFTCNGLDCLARFY